MKRLAVALTLTVAFCSIVVPMSLAEEVTPSFIRNNLKNKHKVTSIPEWQITQDGTKLSVPWVDATNPRFAIHDYLANNDPLNESTFEDDVVLDKETGLVWERSPSNNVRNWHEAIVLGYEKEVAGRKGWRLPTQEELLSLVDPNNEYPALPTDHPFVNVQTFYWSATLYTADTNKAWYVHFYLGTVSPRENTNSDAYTWYVRGGSR